MMSLRIESFEDLIDFIETYDLPFDKYIEVVIAFNYGGTVLWLDDKEPKNKERLIEILKSYEETHFKKGYPLPIFLNINEWFKNYSIS